jgi:hypothetical protein
MFCPQKKAYECYKKDDRSSRSTMVTFKSLTRNVSCIKQFIPYDLTGKRHQIERIHENQINEISKKIKVPYPESIFMWWALKKKMVAGTKVISK